MSDWARKTADKYITKSGAAPGAIARARTNAERAWRTNAETVHKFLRMHAKSPEGAAAIAALERIGDAIAEDEKRKPSTGLRK
jgi:hypothetical protein